jgi:hypothetical protein
MARIRARPSLTSLTLALTVVLHPVAARADAPSEDPYEYRTRWGLVVAGVALFGITYVPSCAGLANAACIPVAGPFILMARRIRDDGRSTSDHDGIVPPVFAYGALAGLGLLELTGVAIAVVGFAQPKRVLKTGVSLALAPVVDARAAGLAVMGRF